ncbi:MAG: hypothetical protein QNJ36_15495 [Calothrix sp. MO_167.B42]|nr:hypothetical protein [Calothrix sp. MO_167.B42]
MKSNDISHLTAFLIALQKLDHPLPGNIQIQLNEIGKSLQNNPHYIDELNVDTLAESYSPLDEIYQKELEKLDLDIRERSKGFAPEPLPKTPTNELTNAAINTFNSDNSVSAAQENVNPNLLEKIRNYITGKKTNE